MLLNYKESLNILDRYDIPLVESFVVDSQESLLSALEKVGFPAVMKIDSKEIVHKSDKGGVKLGIDSENAALLALEELLSIDGSGVIVQKHTKGEEVIIGGKRDGVFGPIVMVGLGGILVEIYKDIVFRLAPLNRDEALGMIEEIKGKTILEGFRGRPVANKESLAELLVKTSSLLEEEKEVKELDFNPVLVGESSLVCDVKLMV